MPEHRAKKKITHKHDLFVCDFFHQPLFFAMCAKATKNFNYVMAGASTCTIIAPEKLVEIGEVNPDIFQVAGVLVDGIVEGEQRWQI